MRIGHQIYNYLNDYTDNGSHTLLNPVEVIPNWPDNTLVSHISRVYINWKEDQVYLMVITNDIPDALTINEFLKWMGGPTKPQSYKPLYQLRDQLKIMAKKKYKSMKHTTSTTFIYHRSSSPFK